MGWCYRENRSTGWLNCVTATSCNTHTHTHTRRKCSDWGLNPALCVGVLCKLYSLFQLVISCSKVAHIIVAPECGLSRCCHALGCGNQARACNLLACRFGVGFVSRQWLFVLIGCAGHSVRTAFLHINCACVVHVCV